MTPKTWSDIERDFDDKFKHLDYCHIRSIKRECSCYKEEVKQFYSTAFSELLMGIVPEERDRVDQHEPEMYWSDQGRNEAIREIRENIIKAGIELK